MLVAFYVQSWPTWLSWFLQRPSLGSSKGPKSTDPLMVQAGLGEGGVQVEPHGLVQGLGLA